MGTTGEGWSVDDGWMCACQMFCSCRFDGCEIFSVQNYSLRWCIVEIWGRHTKPWPERADSGEFVLVNGKKGRPMSR